MAPFFAGIAGAIKGQAGFGLGRKARGKSLVKTINTFSSPGSITIPGASTSVIIKAHGAEGQRGGAPFGGGKGGYVEGTFTTLSGTTLNVSIAGKGIGPSSPQYNASGGNYAGVFNGPVTHGNSLMIAGGGGGGGYDNLGTANNGGNGGGTTGASGGNGTGPGTAAGGGGGGSQSSGGSGGAAGSPSDPFNGGSNPGGNGSALQGGFGGPGSWQGGIGGGAGGGGYYGGGGGGAGASGPGIFAYGGGGGGGSSYIHPTATATTNTQGGSTQPGGYVEITYSELL